MTAEEALRIAEKAKRLEHEGGMAPGDAMDAAMRQHKANPYADLDAAADEAERTAKAHEADTRAWRDDADNRDVVARAMENNAGSFRISPADHERLAYYESLGLVKRAPELAAEWDDLTGAQRRAAMAESAFQSSFDRQLELDREAARKRQAADYARSDPWGGGLPTE